MPETVRQLALSLETHRNHFLFSDHYLTEVLLQQPEWRMVEAETRQALEAITALYDRQANSLPHYNEAEAEEHWIRPVLKILCHAYEVQPSLPGALGTPDYALFANEDNRHAAAPNLGKPAYWESALSVADAKRWEHPLDKRIVNGATDAFTNANPCYQIDYYLRHTGCTWGVLSNGRQWRLFHHDSSFRLDVYYEVDLIQLIEQGNLANFRYFYLFFRAAAFCPDAEGRCWLDDVLAQSKAYAVRVGDELKGQVYEALRLLAQGLLDYPAGDPDNALDPATDLPLVHDACLILLYRLLFLLFAESRDLLPLSNPGYARQYSLKAIKEEIAQKLDSGVVYLAKKATIWDDLRTLFEIIYSGQEALGVPAYNGGLFDPSHYPFLEEQAIGDQYLAGAIDLLSRAKAGLRRERSAERLHRERSAERRGQGLSFVDYRDLSVRHLGSIYEGLLEYKLAYAAEEMAIVKGRKHEEIVPVSGAGEDKVVERIPAGRVYLVTDRGERKATGSYYTPGYIVKYIVEHTLGPLVDAQAKAVEDEIAALKARNKGGARRTKAYRKALADMQNSFADRVLALNALDPAMGSGHFLVEATDYLARRIVEAGVVTEALAKGDEESELSYWRRRVVERCIYGVDLNPLAVELTKLSLWLATVAKGKPLSFLDHHLRCGNSLIGARVADLQTLPVRKKRRRRKTSEVSQTSEVSEVLQLAMWDESTFTQDMFRVVGAMRQIQEYVTDDLVSVKEKERLFEETVERERRKWRSVADLWTATYFGLELAQELYNACVQHIQGKPVLLQAAQAEALLSQAHRIWEQKRFFHWEIEFPEVFFDQYGRHKGDAAGFDAVVGNPPYVNIVRLDALDVSFYRVQFATFRNKCDLYSLFLEKGLSAVGRGGRLGFVVSNTWFATESFSLTRKLMLSDNHTERIAFPPPNAFREAVVETVITITARQGWAENASISVEQYDADSGIFVEVDSFPCSIVAKRAKETANFAQPAKYLQVYSSVEHLSRPLSTIASFSLGIKTSNDSEFVHAGKLHSVDVPTIRGRNIERYGIEFGREYLHYDVDLLRSRHGARPREREAFERPAKIVLQEIAGGRLICALDRTSLFCLDTVNVIFLSPHSTYSLTALIALLNSRLLTFWYGTQYPGSHVKLNEIAKVPIRDIDFTNLQEERARVAGEAQVLYESDLSRADSGGVETFDRVLGFVRDQLAQEPERADVVHDLLAFLAERMIEMNKEKQTEVHGFLDWLADYTGRPVDDWALKTNVRRYYEPDWDEMQRILRRNQRKLPKIELDVEAYKSEPASKIRAAWEKSMETLRPLLACIEATDRLIDRIVYQLYGLTEEEIEIVEGRKK